MEQEIGSRVLSWVHGGLDSLMMGLSVNAFGVAAASTLVDRIHLQSPAANAVAGGLTALALVPLNYGLSAVSGVLRKYSPRSTIELYFERVLLAMASAASVYSLYLAVSSPAYSFSQETDITSFVSRPGSTAERSEKLGLLDIYHQNKEAINIASEIYDVPASLIVANIHVESRGDSQAVSCTGAVGLMQLVVDTAKAVDVTPGNYNLVKNPSYTCDGKRNWPSTREGCNKMDTSKCDYTNDERFNPDKNIMGGAKNLRNKFKARKNWREALNDNAGGSDPAYYLRVWARKEKFEAISNANSTP